MNEKQSYRDSFQMEERRRARPGAGCFGEAGDDDDQATQQPHATPLPPDVEQSHFDGTNTSSLTSEPGGRHNQHVVDESHLNDDGSSFSGGADMNQNDDDDLADTEEPPVVEAFEVVDDTPITHAVDIQPFPKRQYIVWVVMGIVVIAVVIIGALVATQQSDEEEPTQDSSMIDPPTSAPSIATPSPTAPLATFALCSSSSECTSECCSNAFTTSDGSQRCIADQTVCDEPSSVSTPVTTFQEPYIGYFHWTWTDAGLNPMDDPNVTFSIAYSGFANIQDALPQSDNIFARLQQEKYLSVGGSGPNGYWNTSTISALDSAISDGSLGAYQGIVYHIAHGDEGLATRFGDSFSTAKSNGLDVIVTVSHSGPWGFVDAFALMESFFVNSNIDAISPMLLNVGDETSNDYTESVGISWLNYRNSIPAIVPTLVRGGSHYVDARTFFHNLYNITIQGYIKWSQT